MISPRARPRIPDRLRRVTAPCSAPGSRAASAARPRQSAAPETARGSAAKPQLRHALRGSTLAPGRRGNGGASVAEEECVKSFWYGPDCGKKQGYREKDQRSRRRMKETGRWPEGERSNAG
eukprot:4419703-Pleurochrysis_carterae.AAC.1